MGPCSPGGRPEDSLGTSKLAQTEIFAATNTGCLTFGNPDNAFFKITECAGNGSSFIGNNDPNRYPKNIFSLDTPNQVKVFSGGSGSFNQFFSNKPVFFRPDSR